MFRFWRASSKEELPHMLHSIWVNLLSAVEVKTNHKKQLENSAVNLLEIFMSWGRNNDSKNLYQRKER